MNGLRVLVINMFYGRCIYVSPASLGCLYPDNIDKEKDILLYTLT